MGGRQLTTGDLAVSLAILRSVLGFSQADLAEKAGVTNSAISDYERGKVDPQTQTLYRLLRAFGLPLSALQQTQAFILMIRAQVEGQAAAGADSVALEERELRVEIAQLASEGGRFASRLTRVMLELLAGRNGS